MESLGFITMMVTEMSDYLIESSFNSAWSCSLTTDPCLSVYSYGPIPVPRPIRAKESKGSTSLKPSTFPIPQRYLILAHFLTRLGQEVIFLCWTQSMGSGMVSETPGVLKPLSWHLLLMASPALPNSPELDKLTDKHCFSFQTNVKA